jgi:hypothetical protein
VYGQQHVSPPFIHSKSRMRKRARTDLRGGRSAMVVPTATVTMTMQTSLGSSSQRMYSELRICMPLGNL